MSRFSGPQHKGASRDAKALRREEAQQRQRAYDVLLANGPDEVRQYRNRLIRPRLGRQLRDASVTTAGVR